MSEAEIRKRVRPVNLELANKYYDQGTSFVAMVSHMCNWEWVGLACSIYLKAENVAIYQQQANLKVNDWLIVVRSRFGAVPLEKKKVLRHLVKRKKIASAIGIIADQSPGGNENRFWTTFLNQDTAFFTGGEKIARKFDFPVLYIIMKRIKRGYYEMHFEEIAEPPFYVEENAILGKFAEKLQDDIRENPSDWLWSHNRWKLRKPI